MFLPIFCIQLFNSSGGKFQNDSLENNGLEWKDGYIYCTLCETYIKRPVDMKQHCKSARHQSKLKDAPVIPVHVPEETNIAAVGGGKTDDIMSV